MSSHLNIDELRRDARRRLPRAVFDFIDGGAEDEVSLRLNREAFEAVTFSARVLVDVSQVSTEVEVLGRRLRLPVLLAPTGLCGMAAPRGELMAARAAVRAGIVFVASCMSAVTMEEIAREAPGDHWFQLYIWRDRGLTRSLVERAAAAGYSCLVVTVDVPVLGQRERDVRNGATIPPHITWRNALDTLRRPGWLRGMARAPRIEFANVVRDTSGRGSPLALSSFVNGQFDPAATWDDLDWIRQAWKGSLIVKGVMAAQDARLALEHGADGVVVSNHGGRQLDGLPASLDVLPEVAAAMAGRGAVLFDGGVRRGTDLAKAIALGAQACLIGRPYLYGLGAAGESGVARSLEILESELRRALCLLGRRSVVELDAGILRPARSWSEAAPLV